MEKIISIEQIMELTNQEKRKAFLADWRKWPVLIQVPELYLDVREIILPDGNRFTAAFYEGDAPTYHPEAPSHDPLLGIQKPAEEYHPLNVGETCLVRHLTQLRKALKTMPEEEITRLLAVQNDVASREIDQRIVANAELDALSFEDVRKIQNNPSREQFARHAQETWPLWVEVPAIGMKVFRLGLPYGQIMCVTTFGDRAKKYLTMVKGKQYSSNNSQEYAIVTLLRDQRVRYLAELRNLKNSKQNNQAI